MSQFQGRCVTEWLTDEPLGPVQMKDTGLYRRMRLLEDFAFYDPQGKRWNAPAGSIIDGASIPTMLWSVVGSPYIGHFRRASVLHDVACQKRTEPSKTVHRMFFDAIMADGANEAQAVEFYASVRLFGPRWGALTLIRPSIDLVAGGLDIVLGE